MEENNMNKEYITNDQNTSNNNVISSNENIIEPPIVNQNVEQTQIVEPESANEVKTSGTADESELYIDAVKPEAEIIDEYEIKKNVLNEKKRYKRNTLFIVIVTLLIVAFIVLLPFITKWIGY